MMDKKRPIGVNIAAAAMIIFGSFNALNIIRFHTLNLASAPSLVSYSIVNFLGLGLNILLILCAVSIFKLRQSGRIVGIIVLAVSSLSLCFLCFAFLSMWITSRQFSPWALLKGVEFLSYITIIIYLTRSKVKEQFR